MDNNLTPEQVAYYKKLLNLAEGDMQRIVVLSKDQSLPDIRYRWHEELDPKWTQEAVQSDMLNSNWVRVIKKGEVNEL